MNRDIIRNSTKKAIRNGTITVPDICDDCKTRSKVQCHHNNYDDAFDISFLCSICHDKRHLRGGMKLVKVQRATCGKCGHEWQPRVEKPVACPRCKNNKWLS